MESSRNNEVKGQDQVQELDAQEIEEVSGGVNSNPLYQSHHAMVPGVSIF